MAKTKMSQQAARKIQSSQDRKGFRGDAGFKTRTMKTDSKNTQKKIKHLKNIKKFSTSWNLTKIFFYIIYFIRIFLILHSNSFTDPLFSQSPVSKNLSSFALCL